MGFTLREKTAHSLVNHQGLQPCSPFLSQIENYRPAASEQAWPWLFHSGSTRPKKHSISYGTCHSLFKAHAKFSLPLWWLSLLTGSDLVHPEYPKQARFYGTWIWSSFCNFCFHSLNPILHRKKKKHPSSQSSPFSPLSAQALGLSHIFALGLERSIFK